MTYTEGQRVERVDLFECVAGTVVDASPFYAWVDWDDGDFGIYAHDDQSIRQRVAVAS